MAQLTLDSVKKQLNIPGEYTGDDEYIENDIIPAVVDYATSYLDVDKSDSDYTSKLDALLKRPMVNHAMLMLSAAMYNNRESTVYAEPRELKAYSEALAMCRNWTV